MKKKNRSFKPLIPIYDRNFPIDWTKEFEGQASLVVEIGFGLGEVLMRLAQESPRCNFVGIEEHEERIYKTLGSIDRKGLGSNIRILDIDAKVAFGWFFNPQSLDKIFSLFPCPWPKRGHTRNRLFSKNFLQLVNNRLKDQGEFQIVTDHKPYYEWIIAQSKDCGFSRQEKSTQARFNTKFEKKWQARGQEEFYELIFVKEKHIETQIPKLEELKSYKLKDFDPQKFNFQELRGELSIVLKDYVYDQQKKRALIRLVVVEENISQHFWVDIINKNDQWLLKKAEGQQIFQTPGLQKALELVYEAASS